MVSGTVCPLGAVYNIKKYPLRGCYYGMDTSLASAQARRRLNAGGVSRIAMRDQRLRPSLKLKTHSKYALFRFSDSKMGTNRELLHMEKGIKPSVNH